MQKWGCSLRPSPATPTPTPAHPTLATPTPTHPPPATLATMAPDPSSDEPPPPSLVLHPACQPQPVDPPPNPLAHPKIQIGFALRCHHRKLPQILPRPALRKYPKLQIHTLTEAGASRLTDTPQHSKEAQLPPSATTSTPAHQVLDELKTAYPHRFSRNSAKYPLPNHVPVSISTHHTSPQSLLRCKKGRTFKTKCPCFHASCF